MISASFLSFPFLSPPFFFFFSSSLDLYFLLHHPVVFRSSTDPGFLWPITPGKKTLRLKWPPYRIIPGSGRATLCSMRNEYRLCFWKGLSYPAIFFWCCSSDLKSHEKRLSLRHRKTELWSPTLRQGSGRGIRVTKVRLLSMPETMFINPSGYVASAAQRPQWKDTQLLPNMSHFKKEKKEEEMRRAATVALDCFPKEFK